MKNNKSDSAVDNINWLHQLEKRKDILSDLYILAGELLLIECRDNILSNEVELDNLAYTISTLKGFGINVMLVINAASEGIKHLRNNDDNKDFILDKDFVGKLEKFIHGDILTTALKYLNNYGNRCLNVHYASANCVSVKKMNVLNSKYKNVSELIDLGYLAKVDNINNDYIDGLIDNDIIPIFTSFGLDVDRELHYIPCELLSSALITNLDILRYIIVSDKYKKEDNNSCDNSITSNIWLDKGISQLKEEDSRCLSVSIVSSEIKYSVLQEILSFCNNSEDFGKRIHVKE